jgi:hypothetical protein
MKRSCLLTTAAVLAIAPAALADVPVDDFEQVTDWKGLDPDTEHVKQGTTAGRWDDHPNQKSARKEFSPALDVSKERMLQFWVWSAVANGAELQLVLDSDNAADAEGWDYYSRPITVDWAGWRLFVIPLEDFNVSRKPVGWHELNYISFSADGWGHSPKADTVLVFDDMAFGSGAIASLSVQQGWQGADYVYNWSIGLEDRLAMQRNLTLAIDTPPGYPFLPAVGTPQVSLPPSGTGTASVSIKIPAAEITPATRLRLERATVTVSEQGAIRDAASLDAAVPLPARQHPRTLLDQADLDRIGTWADEEAWAKAARDALVSGAQKWPAGFLQKYGVTQWQVPAEGGQWGQHYVCPKHGVYLTYTPPMTHTCPVDKQSLTGWPYDQVIFSRMHQDLAAAARDLALASRLGGDPSLAQTAAQILLAYADQYDSFAIHTTKGTVGTSGARVLSQTLDESVWLIPMAFAYDLVADSAALDAAQRAHIERDLLQAAAKVIARNEAGMSNWQSWHNAAILGAALAIDDPVMTARAWQDPSNGFLLQMQKSVSADGFWYEGSWGYHFYALDALVNLAEMAVRAGLDPYGQASLRKMFEAPVLFAMPDGTLPPFNDSGTSNLRKQTRPAEIAYNRYQDPALASFLSSSGRGRDALLWGAKNLPAAQQSQLPSLLFPDSGYAVLRAESTAGTSYLALDFGPHGGGHGHYDKLGYVLFARGGLLGLDPGTQSYAAPTHATWDKATIAHNTVVVDETTQPEGTGKLHRFVSLPSASFAAAEAADASPKAALLRSMLLTPDYVVDRVRAVATDGLSQKLDWIHHAPGEVSVSAPLAPWSALPSSQGYQHLSKAQGAEVAGDWKVSFAQPPQPGPYGSTYADKASILSSFAYSNEQAASGSWSGKMTYDFSQASGYILFNTPDLAEIAEVPGKVRFQLYGDGSGNELSVRLYDATDERFVRSLGPIDWTGWKQLEAGDLASWSHYLGNADGIFDVPARRIALDLKYVAGKPQTGALYSDDLTVDYAGSGAVLASDFELLSRGLRLWMTGEAGTSLVTGEGLGPDLLVPVPFAMARRNAADTTFLTLLETYGDAASVTAFAALPTTADPAEQPLAVQVESPAFRDRILALADPKSSTQRSFGDCSCDGTLCLLRTGPDGGIRRVAASDATRVGDGTADRTISQAALAALQVDWDEPGQRVDVSAQAAIDTELRLWGPAIAKVYVAAVDTPFTRDGDYVVLNLVPTPDAGLPDGGGLESGAPGDASSEAGSGPAAAGGGAEEDGCGCRAAGRDGGRAGVVSLLAAALALFSRRRVRRGALA